MNAALTSFIAGVIAGLCCGYCGGVKLTRLRLTYRDIKRRMNRKK